MEMRWGYDGPGVKFASRLPRQNMSASKTAMSTSAFMYLLRRPGQQKANNPLFLPLRPFDLIFTIQRSTVSER